MLAALSLDDAEISRIGRNARERTLDQHTSAHRAAELCRLLEDVHRPQIAPSQSLHQMMEA
jgi:hypothetical protein